MDTSLVRHPKMETSHIKSLMKMRVFTQSWTNYTLMLGHNFISVERSGFVNLPLEIHGTWTLWGSEQTIIPLKGDFIDNLIQLYDNFWSSAIYEVASTHPFPLLLYHKSPSLTDSLQTKWKRSLMLEQCERQKFYCLHQCIHKFLSRRFVMNCLTDWLIQVSLLGGWLECFLLWGNFYFFAEKWLLFPLSYLGLCLLPW